jgi:pimeloyl-ACP methyl ester carboxylesterase
MTSNRRSRIIRGLKTGWLESGSSDKPILLLLHGYPDGPAIWDRQDTYFNDRFQVIRPETRGVLDSERATRLSRMSTEALAFDILEILKAVDPSAQRPVFCAGHDMGAAVAWTLAPLLGTRLKGLIAVNGLSTTQMLRRLFRPSQIKKSWYMFLMQTPVLPEVITTLVPSLVQRFAYAIGDLAPQDRPEIQAQDCKYPLNQYRAFVRELPKLLLNPAPKLTCPVMVLWGSDDAFVLPPTLDELEPYARKVEVRILKGNHWIFRSEAAKVNPLIDDFTRRSWAGV